MRSTALRTTAGTLTAKHGFSAEEADLLARKAHSVDQRGENLGSTVFHPVNFVSLVLPDDLIVKTPLVIDSSVNSLWAKDVHIFRAGSIRPMSSYFLLQCESIRGEGFWWEQMLTTTVSNDPPQVVIQ
jgi:hypothetical protein